MASQGMQTFRLGLELEDELEDVDDRDPPDELEELDEPDLLVEPDAPDVLEDLDPALPEVPLRLAEVLPPPEGWPDVEPDP
jgi:hypothetical protein